MGADDAVASPGQILHRYVHAFIDGLAAAGVRDLCLCPGSRSTPLALEAWRHPQITVWVHLDERSCGYFALGLAKGGGAPVAIVCTSGTAATNFFPAVAEAALAQVPLVVLTSDRPPELRDVGAAQTIDQIKLFGSHVKSFTEMATPAASPVLLRYARHRGARATATAAAAPAGPVHCNFPFPEPLIPAPDTAAGAGPAPEAPPLIQHIPHRPDPRELAPSWGRLREAERGIIVCGPQADPEFPAQVARLAALLGYPILADPLSWVRGGSQARDLTIHGYDGFLRDATIAQRLRPDAVIRFGATPTSRPLLQFLDGAANDGAPLYQLLVTEGDGWNDPSLLATAAVNANATAFCRSLLSSAMEGAAEPAASPDWRTLWRTCAKEADAAISDCFERDGALSEPRVVWELAGLLPDGATLFAGNSMPIRDVDSFFPGRAEAVRVLANRGAGGIDGLISSALGASAASDGPLALLIGDLSFYHDLNGLLAAKQHRLRATIIVLNNDGGGIFSFLPQAEEVPEFEPLFGTPHGLTFAPAAELFGLQHNCVDAVAPFREAVAASLAQPGVQIIEVKTDRRENAALHRQIWSAIAARVSAALRDLPSR